MYEIPGLSDVLQKCIGDCAVLGYKAKRLTALGENYGSLILAVDVEIENGTNDKKVISLVAKLLPQNEWIRQMFKVHITFKKEMEFYNTIVPTLEDFSKKQGVTCSIDFVPKFYGGRVSLNPDSQEVDDGAVLLVENLKLKGYGTVERTKGFGLDTSELILKDLATFHAVPIALKLKDPQRFKEKIAPHLKIIAMFAVPPEKEVELRKEQVKIALESGEFDHLAKRIERGLEIGEKIFSNPSTVTREPFATITHNDYWVNNTMIKFEGDKPVANKMVDFQIIDYGSPAKDLLFFLFTSVQASVLENNYDHLIQVYYDKFISVLSELGCDITQFSFEAFQKELDIEAVESQFFHTIVMLKPIFAERENVKEMEELSEDDLNNDNISQQHKERQWFIIREFAKRNWI